MITSRAKTSVSLQPWGDRTDVRELATRLKMMLPGGEKLDDKQVTALAQGAVAHGLDPLNGEVWMIPGRGLMIGVKGLRKKAREQVHGNFWINFIEITDPDARRRMRIPENALVYEARLFDSENITAYCDMVSKMTKAGAPWEWVVTTIGDKPFTTGIGILLPGEPTKMQPVQCAMKRAEADALKRRFDVPFGLAVEADEPNGVIAGEWTEPASDETDYSDPEQVDAAIDAEKRKKDKASLYGKDE